MKMKKSVGIWIRVSTEDQAKGESPEHHEHRARSYADSKDWQVAEVYHLEAVSGKSVIEHLEAKRMMKDILEGKITGLIFSKLARLARNTRELLDFAEFFRVHNADLISLHESLDTSTPAGRFFYTLISAMAEWEREEIAERVRASVPIRAKLGKSLGGEAPYGYKWVDKKLEIEEEEAQIRKLMFELFLQHKRKRRVADLINDMGYRTRKGKPFSDSTVHRCLSDPIAKGMRRVNYTKSTGDGKHWELKPKDEWVFQEAPRIVSDEIWDSAQHILKQMSTGKRTRRTAIHLFSGVLECSCGSKMYMRNKSPRYVCKNSECKNKIEPGIVEEIFTNELKNFIFSDTEIQKHLDTEKGRIYELEKRLNTHQEKCTELNIKIQKVLDLFYAGEIEREAFKQYHEPLYEQLQQHKQSVTELSTTIDTLKMQTLSNDQVLHDARSLYDKWETFSVEDKKVIVDAITTSIVVGNEDIEINLNYIPTITDIDADTINNETASAEKAPPTSPLLFLPLKLVQLCNARTWIHTCY